MSICATYILGQNAMLRFYGSIGQLKHAKEGHLFPFGEKRWEEDKHIDLTRCKQILFWENIVPQARPVIMIQIQIILFGMRQV